jgi:hypothetical protein
MMRRETKRMMKMTGKIEMEHRKHVNRRLLKEFWRLVFDIWGGFCSLIDNQDIISSQQLTFDLVFSE